MKNDVPKALTELEISEERSKTGCYAHGDQATIRINYQPGMNYLLCQKGVDDLFASLSQHVSKEMYNQLKDHFIAEYEEEKTKKR